MFERLHQTGGNSDRVLELVWYDEALYRTHPGLRMRVPEATAAYLDGPTMILVRDEAGWSLELEGDRIVLTITPGAAALAAKIPARRDGDRV